jgi:large conductance mechanosensitive channel
MKILHEFREFISRGSMVDLAVGVIIGAAYSKIITSLVDQVIMPPIGLITGGADFSQLKWVIEPAMGKRAEVAIQYGAFVNTLIQFLIIGISVFLLVKMVNTLRRLTAREQEAAAEAAAPTPSEALLTEIRDLLKAQAGGEPPAQPHQKGRASTKRS